MNFRLLIFSLFAVAVLGALFFTLKPRQEAPVAANKIDTIHAENVASAPQKSVQTFELFIKKGKLVSGPQRIKVQQNSEIELIVNVDHDDELHLHGYDLKLNLKADELGKMRFTAMHSGRFGLELHHTHGDISALEVMPKP